MSASIPVQLLHVRRAQLVQDQGKALASFNAISGALRLVDELIATAEKPATATEPVASGGSKPALQGQETGAAAVLQASPKS